MSRNIGQPVKFYFRGGARDPPLTAKLYGNMRDKGPDGTVCGTAPIFL